MPRPRSACPAALAAALLCIASCDRGGSSDAHAPGSAPERAPGPGADVDAGVRALAAGDAAAAERLLAEAVRRAPDDARAHFHLGRAHFAQASVTLGAFHVDVERLAAAEECFDTALRLEPGDAATHVQRGLVAFRRTDNARAERELRRALELQGALPYARAQLGAVLAAQGRLEEAVSELERAIELDPSAAAAHSELGKTALELERYDRALVAFDAVLALQPDDPNAWWGRAQALRLLGRGHEADEAVARQRELAEQASAGPSEARKLAMGSFREAAGHMRAQRVVEARAGFEDALAIDPTLASAHVNLGLIAEHVGDAARARAEYAAALELNGTLEKPRIRLAELLAADGDVDAAAAAARELLEHNPEHVGARSLLARLER